MKRQLTKVEQNIVKGVAIALSVAVLSNIGQGNSKPVGQVAEAEEPVAIAAQDQEPVAAPLSAYCNHEYQRLTIQTYDMCVKEGMSY